MDPVPVVDPEIDGIVLPMSPDLLDSEGPEVGTAEVGQQSTEWYKPQLLENVGLESNRKCVDHLTVLHNGEFSANAHKVEEQQPYEDEHSRPAGDGGVEHPGLVEALLHPNNLRIFYFLEAED